MAQNTNAQPRRRRRSPWRRRLALLLFAALAVGAWLHFRQSAKDGDEAALADNIDRYHTVGRGDFEVMVLLDGTLDAIKRYELVAEARTGRYGDLVVAFCVEENQEVKVGDKVMEFQAEKYLERIDELQTNLEENSKERDLRTDELSMKRSENLSKLKSNVDNLSNKENALERYIQMDAPRTRKTHHDSVSKATRTVSEAKAALATARANRRNDQTGDADAIAKLDAAVTSADTTLNTREQELATALHNQRVWKRYEHPQKLRTLRQEIAQAQLNLATATVQSRNSLFQTERNLNSLNRRRRQFLNDLKNNEEDLAKLIIYAPVDGLVNLGNVNRPHWQQIKDFKIGTTVTYKEIVASIPDLSRFQVKCQIPEEQRSRVKVGLDARFSSPVIPNFTMHGKLFEISPVANTIVRWDPNSPKVYDARITTDTVDSRLMPGMSVKIEIVVETVSDVVFVPVEAVYNKEGKKYVRVKTITGGVEREVDTGRTSLSLVEIVSGLVPGEEVQLFNLSMPESR